MNDEVAPDGQMPAQYFDFLCYLARLHLDPRLRSQFDPEDIAQQTLLKAHQGWSTFRGQNELQVKAWLRQMLRRTVANALRDALAAKRDLFRERSLEAVLEQSSARMEAGLAAEQSTPSEQAVRNERTLQLEKALADLPERQRDAVVLRDIHGWPQAEIAEHLGTSVGAVAGLLRRGYQTLRERLPPE